MRVFEDFIKRQLPKFVFLIPIVINYASYHFGEQICLHIRCRHFSLYHFLAYLLQHKVALGLPALSRLHRMLFANRVTIIYSSE